MNESTTKTISLGYRPHPYQQQVHDAILRHRFCVLVCHRRFGKTLLAVFSLIDAALRHDSAKYPNGRYAYIAPYRNQAKEIAWLYLLAACLRIDGVKKNESELWVEFPNGARITLYGADNADTIRGKYFDGVVGDELADWKAHVWGEILRPALADRLGWALFIGTPKGINLFYELYVNAQQDPEWYTGMYRADETELDHLPRSEIEAMRMSMSDAEFRQEMLCDFDAAADNVLITIDMVAEACARRVPNAEFLHGLPKVIGVDVARFGDDRSVIVKRWGHLVYEPEVLSNVDNMHLAGMVANRIAEFKPDATFVDGGRGEGVIDRLRQLGHTDVFEVQFGGKANNPRYANKRSEMWDLGRQWLTEGGALPNNAELKTDLCVPTYSFNGAGNLILESKDSIKERGMKSPDIADAVMCTFAEVVVPKQTGNQSGNYAPPAVANNSRNDYTVPWKRGF
jgi:hypothetical protein